MSFKSKFLLGLTALLFLSVPKKICAQIVDAGTAPAGYNVPGRRDISGLLKLGQVIPPSAGNLFIGSGANNFGGNIGPGRQFNLQVERGNIAHLLKVSSNTTAFGTGPNDIWSTIGIKLNGAADFYGYKSQWNS